MTDLTNETEKKSLGGSALNGGLGELTTRARNVLMHAGFKSVDEVRLQWRRTSEYWFMKEPNCGKRTAAEIKAWAEIDTAKFPALDVILAIDLLSINGYTVLPPNA